MAIDFESRTYKYGRVLIDYFRLERRLLEDKEDLASLVYIFFCPHTEEISQQDGIVENKVSLGIRIY